MPARELKKNVFAVGALHWDRRLFDELIPLPDGTTYNSYFIKGSEKNALIDAVDTEKGEELLAHLRQIAADKIDYIISNHGEQDHSGFIPKLLEMHPGAKVVTNAKCKDILRTHLLLPEEKFITIKDRETLSLGDRTLEFILTPWVHWPDTMFTYLREEKILFSCDFLGSHLAGSDLFATDREKVYVSAKRYYAEIMMPFRSAVQNALAKAESLDADMIAPSHGPVYNNKKFILEAYRDWSSDKVKNEVILPYVSMHGSVAKMTEQFIESLIKRNITVKPFNLTKADIGELAMSLVDAATIVIGTPTVLTGAHPSAVYAAYLVNALRPKTRFVSVIGSFGWGSNMLEQLKSMLTNLKSEFIEPVIIKGLPDKTALEKIDKLAENITAAHKKADITTKH